MGPNTLAPCTGARTTAQMHSTDAPSCIQMQARAARAPTHHHALHTRLKRARANGRTLNTRARERAGAPTRARASRWVRVRSALHKRLIVAAGGSLEGEGDAEVGSGAPWWMDRVARVTSMLQEAARCA